MGDTPHAAGAHIKTCPTLACVPQPNRLLPTDLKSSAAAHKSNEMCTHHCRGSLQFQRWDSEFIASRSRVKYGVTFCEPQFLNEGLGMLVVMTLYVATSSGLEVEKRDKFGRDLEWPTSQMTALIAVQVQSRTGLASDLMCRPLLMSMLGLAIKHIGSRSISSHVIRPFWRHTETNGPSPLERTTHPWHSWHHTCRQANCKVCGLRLTTVSSPARLRELAGQPCPMTMMDLVPFGVHYTHSFSIEGVSWGWLCRCKLLLKMNSRDEAWHRAFR